MGGDKHGEMKGGMNSSTGFPVPVSVTLAQVLCFDSIRLFQQSVLIAACSCLLVSSSLTLAKASPLPPPHTPPPTRTQKQAWVLDQTLPWAPKMLAADSAPSMHVSDSLWPYEPQSARFLCLWDFPGKNTGVGCHFFLQGIFLNQGSNSWLLHCRQILYHWATGKAPPLPQEPRRFHSTTALLQA